MRYDLPIFLLIFSLALFSSGLESERTEKYHPIHESAKFTDITIDVGIQFRAENSECRK